MKNQCFSLTGLTIKKKKHKVNFPIFNYFMPQNTALWCFQRSVVIGWPSVHYLYQWFPQGPCCRLEGNKFLLEQEFPPCCKLLCISGPSHRIIVTMSVLQYCQSQMFPHIFKNLVGGQWNTDCLNKSFKNITSEWHVYSNKSVMSVCLISRYYQKIICYCTALRLIWVDCPNNSWYDSTHSS